MKSGTKLCVAIVALSLLFVGGTYAAIITYFGMITITANVQQAVLLDGLDWTQPITEEVTVAGGESFCRLHNLTSQTSVPVTVQFVTTYVPALTDDEIKTTYTTTITEEYDADAYYDNARIMVFKEIGDMNVGEFLAETLEYTVNVTSNPLYAPNICFWITDETNTYVVEAWGKDWSGTGLHTVTIQDFFDGTMGYEVTVDTDYGQLNRISPIRPGTYATWLGTGITEFIEDYGSWTVLSAEVRAQAGAAGGQVLRPVQFKVAGQTINIPDAESLTSVTLQPGETLPFYICYEFAVNIMPKTYMIKSEVKPA